MTNKPARKINVLGIMVYSGLCLLTVLSLVMMSSCSHVKPPLDKVRTKKEVMQSELLDFLKNHQLIRISYTLNQGDISIEDKEKCKAFSELITKYILDCKKIDYGRDNVIDKYGILEAVYYELTFQSIAPDKKDTPETVSLLVFPGYIQFLYFTVQSYLLSENPFIEIAEKLHQ